MKRYCLQLRYNDSRKDTTCQNAYLQIWVPRELIGKAVSFYLRDGQPEGVVFDLMSVVPVDLDDSLADKIKEADEYAKDLYGDFEED